MNQEQQSLIKAYLSDESKRYQDWYQGLNPQTGDPSTIPFASLPSMGAVKQRFQKWVEKNQAWLKQKICVEWGYSRKHEEFQSHEMLILSLTADGLTTALPIPTATLAAMTILVAEHYLDNLCTECTQRGRDMMDDALKKHLHNEMANATVKILMADKFSGSGVFIAPEGYVLTAYHCIGECPPPIAIETRFGDQFNAELDEAKSLKHANYDIAVLKIYGKAAHCLPLGTISTQNVTDDVVAMGYPAGDKPEHDNIGFFFSKISQIRADNKIQIPDAIKGRGQSGGPIYHYATKRVIGLATEGYEQDVIMDTGLATRFDALFENWPELEIINKKVVQAWEKRLLALGDGKSEPLTRHENLGITTNDKLLSRQFLSQKPQAKRELINAILACPSMKDSQLRQTIIQQLPSQMADNIPSLPQARAHVINIVDTCLNFSGGLKKLIEAIRSFDENTEPMQALDALIQTKYNP
jgi:S1-C subfamily serine protease